MKRYYIDSKGEIKQFDFMETIPKLKYDKIVDKSKFRQDSETVRQFVSSGVGASGTGVYDDPKNLPDNIIVSIRSGKLDRAEVDQLRRQEIERLKKLDFEQSEKIKADKLAKIDQARQDYLDKATGFKGSPQTV